MAKKDNKIVNSEEKNITADTEVTEEKKNIAPKKTGHFLRNSAVFLILVLGGAAFFLSVQLKKTEELNKASMQELQQSYEQKLSVISTRVNDLQKEINVVKNKPVQEVIGGVSEEFVNQRLAQLKQEFMQSNLSENGEAEPLQQVIIESTPSKQTQEVLLASGAMIVRDLAEQGNKFEYETEVLQILAQGNPQAEKYVDTMQKYASSGIKGKNRLIKSFNKIFAELNDVKLKAEPQPETAEPQNWKDKMIAWAKRIFISKKASKRPVFKQKEDEVYTLVNEGNLQEALNEMKTEEKYAKIDSSALQQWQNQTEEYLEFNNAATGLIMNSIANLHLKEMEH